MTRQAGAKLPISGVVVAGGKSARLGEDKRQLRLWGAEGPTLLEHTVARVTAQCDEVIVVLNGPRSWPTLQGRLVPDIYPNGGALGGIYSGLYAATYHHAFVVAADMPMLNEQLIAWMLRQPRDFDVLTPRVGHARARNRLGVESLHAIYSRACLDPMRRQLEAGNPQVIGFFTDVDVRFVPDDVVRRFDPDGSAFKNVNTREDLEEARAMLRMSPEVSSKEG